MPEGRTAGAQPRSDCACDVGAPIGAYFDRKARTASAREPTLHSTSRALLDLLGDPNGRSVLELGAGRGGLLLELLASGASHVSAVDVSAASVATAQTRLAEAGFAERATFTVADGAVVDLPPRDWVVLDRVICCYPAADAFVANSARAARARYAFAVPESRGWRGLVARVGVGVENLWRRLRGVSVGTFVHPIDRIERALGDAGFRRLAAAHRALWYVAVFERTG